MTDIKQQVANDALDMVSGPRQRAYGPPERNFERICRLWNGHLINRGLASFPMLEPIDVAAFMILMKMARLAETPEHRDSVTDIVGYALCYAELALQPLPVDLSNYSDGPVTGYADPGTLNVPDDDWVDWPADVEPPPQQAAE